jgi:hypothetical protein
MGVNSIIFARERARRNDESRCSRIPPRAKCDHFARPIGTPSSETKLNAMCRNHLGQTRTKPLVHNYRAVRALVGVDCVRFQIFQVTKRKTRFMRRGQNDLWCMTSIKRFLPPRCAEAPFVAGLQTGKAELQIRRRQVVTGGLRECQELCRQDDANCVRSHVLRARVATAVPEKARHRRRAASCQFAAEHVFGLRYPDDAVCFCNANHGQPCFKPLSLAAEPSAGSGVWYYVRRTFQSLAHSQPSRHCNDFRGQWR